MRVKFAVSAGICHHLNTSILSWIPATAIQENGSPTFLLSRTECENVLCNTLRFRFFCSPVDSQSFIIGSLCSSLCILDLPCACGLSLSQRAGRTDAKERQGGLLVVICSSFFDVLRLSFPGLWEPPIGSPSDICLQLLGNKSLEVLTVLQSFLKDNVRDVDEGNLFILMHESQQCSEIIPIVLSVRIKCEG